MNVATTDVLNPLATVLGPAVAVYLGHYVGRNHDSLKVWKKYIPHAAITAILVLVGFSSYDQASIIANNVNSRVPKLEAAVTARDVALNQFAKELVIIAKDDIAHGGHPPQVVIQVPAPPP